MKKVSITLYEFKELSAEAQKKVLVDLADINVFFDWWEDTYKDAESIGLKITGFDSNLNCTGHLLFGSEIISKKISNSYKEEGIMGNLSERIIEELLQGFPVKEWLLKELLVYYSNMLREESKELLGDANVIATIEANDYWFREDGTVFLHGNKTSSEEVDVNKLALDLFPVELDDYDGKFETYDVNETCRNTFVEWYKKTLPC